MEAQWAGSLKQHISSQSKIRGAGVPTNNNVEEIRQSYAQERKPKHESATLSFSDEAIRHGDHEAGH
jgi:hypothetical protein